MAQKWFDRVKFTTATTGTDAIAVDAVFDDAFLTPADALAADGDQATFLVEESGDWQIARGELSASTAVLSIDEILLSKIAGVVGTTQMVLAGNAVVTFTVCADDVNTFNILHNSLWSRSDEIEYTADHTYDLVANNGRWVVMNKPTAGNLLLPDIALTDKHLVLVKNKNNAASVTVTPYGAQLIEDVPTVTITAGGSAILWPDAFKNTWRAVRLLPGIIGSASSLGLGTAANYDVDNFATDLTLVSTAEGAAAGPALTLFRKPVTPPGINYVLGRFAYRGINSAGTPVDYAEDDAVVSDATAGSEDSVRRIRIKVGGAFVTAMQLASTGIAVEYRLIPTVNDGAALGAGTLGFSDAFFASGAVINYANGNYTVTHSSGLLTYSGGLTVSGAFTSLGIDDNATGERLQLADTVMTLGPSSSADYFLGRVLGTGSITIGGDTSSAAGASLQMYGGAHASLAGDINLSSAGGPNLYLDASANQFIFVGNAVLGGSVRFLQNTTDNPGSGNNTVGAGINSSNGLFCISGSSNPALVVNRTVDGNLINLNSGGTLQGIVSVSGATITYGTFFGSHWSQLAGGAARIDILRGTILETIDEMCVWWAFTYVDHEGVRHTSEEVPEGLTVGDTFEFSYPRKIKTTIVDMVEEVVTEMVDESYDDVEVVEGRARVVRKTRQRRRPVVDEYPLHDVDGNPILHDVQALDAKGEPIVDEVAVLDVDGNPVMVRKGRKKVPQTVMVPRTEKVQTLVHVPRKATVERPREEITEIMETVQATVIELQNDQLPRFKISDTPGSHRPYGVFAWWDEDGTDDAFVGAIGGFVVRVAKGETVEGGDLIESNGDGCGRVLRGIADAIEVRRRHVATVTAAVTIETYPDGSYLVPCTLHCG